MKASDLNLSFSTMEEKSFLSLPIFKEPVCFISTSEDGKLQVEQEPLQQIKQIDAQLVVVAIAGLYRTGKSYLLNLLAGSTSGFPLGKTIQSKTKGIWVWCRKHPKKENTVLLLLDTEGLGDVAKGDSGHDNKIFTIAALLSNVLVYNMMSVFNQDAVEKLTFISEMSKNIRFNNAKVDVNDEELGLILPTFVLSLRDFSLTLEKDGKEITPDEYLDDCLQLKCGTDESCAKYNRPRECIRKYFPNRKCFVFDRPGDRKTLEKLETVPFEKLSETFIEETNLFLNYIYTCGPKVLISSKPVNGGMFVTLVESYVNAIRDGAVPDVDDAIMVVAKIENEKMANEAVEVFKEKIEEIKLPILHTSKFEELNREMQKVALARFRSESMFNAEKFEKEAMSKMDGLWGKIKTDNLRLVRQHCESLFQALYIKYVGKKMRQGDYKIAGGYPKYKLDIDATKKDYMINVKDIDAYEAQQVLMNFLNEETKTESRIMSEDQKMTEEDRKRERNKLQTEHRKAQRLQQTLFECKLQEEKLRAGEHQKAMDKERKEYMQLQEERMAALKNEWGFRKKLSEKQMQMMRTQNESQRKSFEAQVNKLKDEHQKIERTNKDWFDCQVRSQNEKTQNYIDCLTQNFKDMFFVERMKNIEMEKAMQLQQQMFLKDKKVGKRLLQQYEERMEEYERKITKLMAQSDENDARKSRELRRLERERNEYREMASSDDGCFIM